MPRGGARPGAGRPRNPGGSVRKSDGRVLVTVGPRGAGAKRSYLERQKLGLQPGNPLTAQHRSGNKYDNRKSNLEVMTRSQNVADENRRGLNRGNKAKAPAKGKSRPK